MPSTPPASPGEYPFEWETSVLLSDGSTARLRPIKPEDRDLLAAFHGRQSQESIYFRYFRFRPELSDKELEYFTNVDYDKRMAFVATIGNELVAVARYESGSTDEANLRPEVAFFVDDAHHGKGLATLMLEYLAAAARQKGLEGFTATVLPENYGMLRVFRKAGFDVKTAFVDGIIEVTLGIEVTPETAEAIDARNQRAQARSVARILHPTSVVVIGAGRNETSVGHQLARYIAEAPFAGNAWAVNPSAAASGETSIAGLPLVADLETIQGEVDLAVVAVPAEAVDSVIDACIAKSIKGLVIVSAGFSDIGPEGVERERALVDLARRNGIRLVGPAAYGVVNTDPEVNLNALFLPLHDVTAGSVAILSQSGPLGAALLDQMAKQGIGISSFVAIGNRADLSTNDLLQFWATDDRTRVIALYQENFGNPRNFARIARDVSQTKPIIAVEPEDPAAIDLLQQAGVIVVRRVSELVEQAEMVVGQPMPEGNRVAVITNASSVGRLAASACRKAGLEVVRPESLEAGQGSDIVLLGDADALSVDRLATPDDYERLISAAAVSANVDSLLLAIVPNLLLPPEQLGQLLHRIDIAVDKPMAAAGLVDQALLATPGLPSFTFPEQAARALGRMAEHSAWRSLPHGDPIRPEPEWASRAEQLVLDQLGPADERELFMHDADLEPLLSALEIPVPSFRIASDLASARAAAEDLGYPVVLKAGGVAQRRLGSQGGTVLGLRSADEVETHFRRMQEELPEDFDPPIVQATAEPGVHLAVELIQDNVGGPRLHLGVGGASARSIEALETVFLPASEIDLDRALETPWLADLFPGEAARYALRDLLARLVTAAEASPDLAAVQFDPVILSAEDAVPVEASVVLRRWRRDPLAEVRHI